MEHINPQDYDVNKLLNYIYFVPIDLDPTDDEQQIFDTINSLGVRLTTADLLKNELFSTSTKDIDFYNSTWRQCFEEDEKDYWEIKVGNRDGRTNVDLFLYAYLSIFSKAKVSFSTLFNSYKEYLTPSKMIPGAYEGIVTKLIQYANSYKEHIQPDIVNNVVTEPKNSIQRLNIVFFGLETATLLPYCLYVLNNAEREEANKIFGLLETYIARRMLCHDQTKNYNKLFAGFITSEILTSDKLKEEFYNKRDTEDRMPTDEDIERLINYNHTNTQIKGLLYLLETGLRQPGKETTNILSLQSYDLEHIMPKDHSKWDSPDDTDEIIKNRETHIWSIGNKTLLSKGLNKSLKNEIYSKKLNGLSAENPGYKTFAMGLRTFNVDNYPTWDEDKIDERQKFLIEKIKEVWPYNTVR